MEEIPTGEEVLAGTFFLNERPIIILFDSGASREFMSTTLSHLVFKPKPNAHSMCAQESSLHTYRIENGDRITNVSI
jgi:hypothetical protein